MSCDGVCKKLKDELIVYSNSLMCSDNENKELKKSLDDVSDTLNKSYEFISMLETRLSNMEYLLGEANKERDIAHAKYSNEFDKNVQLEQDIIKLQEKLNDLTSEKNKLKDDIQVLIKRIDRI